MLSDSHGSLNDFYWVFDSSEERKALRKHSLNGKIAASVLLKLFVSGNKRCLTTDAPSAWAKLYF